MGHVGRIVQNMFVFRGDLDQQKYTLSCILKPHINLNFLIATLKNFIIYNFIQFYNIFYVTQYTKKI